MQHDLKSEGAVVTGAASGIGEATATAFIEASTLLCDLSTKKM
jgi:NADP-dependent 3-hydroxy acid dehydrogenase YdfG